MGCGNSKPTGKNPVNPKVEQTLNDIRTSLDKFSKDVTPLKSVLQTLSQNDWPEQCKLADRDQQVATIQANLDNLVKQHATHVQTHKDAKDEQKVNDLKAAVNDLVSSLNELIGEVQKLGLYSLCQNAVKMWEDLRVGDLIQNVHEFIETNGDENIKK